MHNQIIYALGFFDGVHLGHQALLRTCRELAEKNGWEAGAVTFVTHPETLVRGQAPKLINSQADRRRLLRENGMKRIVELPFDEALRTMPWQDFITLLREEHYAAGFVCGDDFHFGYRGEGTAALLQEACREAGMPCAVVEEQTLEGGRISSTRIRGLLEQGNMEAAVRLLGHPHILTGEVVTGRGLGRTIGVPTANIRLPQGMVIPGKGVYACKARVGERTYLAVTNVGSRPTVEGHHVTVEPWLLDFEGDLYGKELVLEFYAFLRPERKFDSLEALKEEIEKNAAQTRKILEKT